MDRAFEPIEKTSLSDDLTARLAAMIRSGTYSPGDRLPSIMKMAQSFGVGHPTLREALRKLEVIGLVEIKHGSGVYVGQRQDVLLISNPVFGGEVSRKLMLDLIEARLPVETTAAGLAALHAEDHHLKRMAGLLAKASEHLEDDAVLSPTNMAFHQEIAVASGNTVLVQLLEVLVGLFRHEQRVILGLYGSREQDHREHLGILDAVHRHEAALAQARMQAHLEGVREALLRWDPERTPLS